MSSWLAHDRLRHVGEGEVEVAHEALLRSGRVCADWLEDDAQGAGSISTCARQPRLEDRADPAELYRGARLASALEWAAVHD